MTRSSIPSQPKCLLHWKNSESDEINLSGLAAVEEAGGEEDDGDHKGQAGVKDVVEAEAEEAVGQPRCKAQEPYPRCLSHHAHAPERGRGQGRTGAVRWPLFYTK